MTREKLGTIGNLSVERVTFELENWIPVKDSPLQNQAYCSVQRMSIMLNSCGKEMEKEECSRQKPTDIITIRKSPDVRIEGDGIIKFKYDMDFQIIIPNELPAKEKAWLDALMEHH